jgi:hypothetical protein
MFTVMLQQLVKHEVHLVLDHCLYCGLAVECFWQEVETLLM